MRPSQPLHLLTRQSRPIPPRPRSKSLLYLSQHRSNIIHTHPPPAFSSSVTDHASALSSLSSLLQSPDPTPTPTHTSPSTGTRSEVGSARGGKWTLTPSRTGLQRTYTFKTFSQAWSFMNVVAEECKRERHHPEWFNCYNEVKITWTTHRPRGLSEKDISMARFCDERAGEMGES